MREYLLPPEYVIEVIAEGDWSLIERFTQEQKLSQDLSPLRLKNLLSTYVRCRSVLAAKILLEWDRDFILKKLDDPDLMVFLDLFSTRTAALDTFLKEIIICPRSDAIWKKAAEKLYAFADLPCPEPYDHLVTLQTFAKELDAGFITTCCSGAGGSSCGPCEGKKNASGAVRGKSLENCAKIQSFDRCAQKS